jgi:hypothetical protein
MAHALHGHARSWVTNEKGLVTLTAALPDAPPRFAECAGDAVAALAPEPTALETALAIAASLLDDVEEAVRPAGPADRRR